MQWAGQLWVGSEDHGRAYTLGWRRLISLIVPENHRSKAVALRLGGRYEKTIPFRGGAAEIFMYDLT